MTSAPSTRQLAHRSALAAAAAAPLIFAQGVSACSVCFGDPNSDLAKGAVRGVAFMIAVTAAMLTGIASIAGVWIVRARRLARAQVQAEDASDNTSA